MTRAPVIVEHVAGLAGQGGPATTLERMMSSSLAQRYRLLELRQTRPAGSIDAALITRWVRELLSIRPDLVHVRGLGNEGFHGVLAARLAGCPRILLSIHGTVRDLTAPLSARRSVLIKAVEPASLRLATHLATVCRAAAERSYLDGVRHKLVGVVPNGVDVLPRNDQARARLRSEWEIGPDDVAVVVVGRLSLEKGHAVLASALDRLGPARNRTVLLIAGDGPDREVIGDGYRCVDGVRLRMLGQRSDIPDVLAAADIFAFPTLHENLSNALIEAMAAGLPVVATAVGGNVEVLEHGGGELVPAGDPAALAAGLQQLIADAETRRKLGRQGVEVITRHFSTERMVTGWDAVYRRVLGLA